MPEDIFFEAFQTQPSPYDDSLNAIRSLWDPGSISPEPVEAPRIAIPMALYRNMGMVGGRTHPRNRSYVLVMASTADRYGISHSFRLDPEGELPPLPSCAVCGVEFAVSEAADLCETCAVRNAATARALANGGRRFGMELEFSLPRNAYVSDYNDDYDEYDEYDEPDPACTNPDCVEPLCVIRRQQVAARQAQQAEPRRVNLHPNSIALALSEAGVPTIVPGYTHAVLDGEWKIVPDGSLNNGYELVSPPMQWDVATEQVPIACKILSDLGCRSTDDCGLHVHHDVGDLTVANGRLLAHNWSACQAQSNMLVDPDRLSSEWCYPSQDSIRQMCDYDGTRLRDFLDIDPERYRPLNWTCWHSYGTVEVRMHESTMNADEILAWIAYTQSIIEASMTGVRIERPENLDKLLDEQLVIRRAARPAATRTALKAKAARVANDSSW